MDTTIEREMFEWVTSRWPKPEPWLPWLVMKVAEETGEVAGAAVKLNEDRATLDDLADEIGDLLITISVLAGHQGWTLDELRSRRWASVQLR